MLRFIRPVPELTICSWIPSWIIGQQQGNMPGTNNFDIAEHPMPIYPGNQHNLGRSLRHDTLSPLPVSDTRLSYTDGTIYMGFNDVAAAKLVVWLS
ncbi:Phenol 2-monooxygenase [Fusarium oxysporum f. sp. albedinis]|nr:Phenol 2-monooxygenase [Fusarium oxysporum f. sp. albedinis]